MKLTELLKNIENKNFNLELNGYSPAEVDVFLNLISNTLYNFTINEESKQDNKQKILDENKKLKKQVDELRFENKRLSELLKEATKYGN
ncbi:DivIVA domain-containing protein [Mycoplasmopsis anatis]|uniref:DivIVA domain-containing protein n=2 Tax=Mycoplasmopsis anatis TaxID=171279 RepID=F9QCZ0_9BACT|nr:DivIVA domain-containing protein [Mycoplasmopsis anatis]AWX70485.1 DivIVA domain-containing protein [Mycoplasmopsis anatis]EGS29372.1 hypothetical protein GIG_01478 [Mycoplasmopsis anatis 1340]MBW0594849.1 DivIVA domain-containing protein [Mycoplasmopsis anatis]MBW0595630.1 DivIVA domain-containing protein [Mycoplasmopsis anatis]MBW0595976.1 DivIVA domain-containing protein [Mycoplasmopsis anatis]